MPPRFQMPTDEEMLAVIRPILVDDKVRRMPVMDSGEPCTNALRERWPQISLKKARSAVRRLRLR